jgi:signal transduction histidine kinase
MSEPVKFLLVDDVEENLLALAALLRREGLEVFTARSGTEALELLLTHDFALAFVDVQMPQMDGFELAELMRGAERSKHVPIIFVTAGAHEPHRVFKGYESGAVDVLYKPIDPQVLRHKANVFFELYRQRQQLAAELRERERLNEELRDTLRLNEMFHAALGHDLRNPLSAIMTGAAILIQRTADEKTMSIGNRILSSGARMGRMIEQLLDLARARLGEGIPLSPSPVDLHDVTERVVAEHKAIEPARAIQVEAIGDLRGTWDEPRLAQVLSNLLGNALQHSAPTTDVSVRLDGTHTATVSFRVYNAGVIPETLKPVLFEPFRSGRDAQRKSEGLGLGLYIVNQVVRAHQGTIHVCSTASKGTTFTVELPRAPVEPHDTQHRRVQEPT